MKKRRIAWWLSKLYVKAYQEAAVRRFSSFVTGAYFSGLCYYILVHVACLNYKNQFPKLSGYDSINHVELYLCLII